MENHRQRFQGWERINRLSGWVVMALSIIALLAVCSGYFQPPQSDEGTAAHIFQLSVAGLAPAIFIFLATLDWKRRWRAMRPLLFSGATLVLAFGALYYLEHFR
jgi:cell division protein FtsW (lipid II flippase)